MNDALSSLFSAHWISSAISPKPLSLGPCNVGCHRPKQADIKSFARRSGWTTCSSSHWQGKEKGKSKHTSLEQVASAAPQSMHTCDTKSVRTCFGTLVRTVPLNCLGESLSGCPTRFLTLLWLRLCNLDDTKKRGSKLRSVRTDAVMLCVGSTYSDEMAFSKGLCYTLTL